MLNTFRRWMRWWWTRWQLPAGYWFWVWCFRPPGWCPGEIQVISQLRPATDCGRIGSCRPGRRRTRWRPTTCHQLTVSKLYSFFKIKTGAWDVFTCPSPGSISALGWGCIRPTRVRWRIGRDLLSERFRLCVCRWPEKKKREKKKREKKLEPMVA